MYRLGDPFGGGVAVYAAADAACRDSGYNLRLYNLEAISTCQT
jgi:hypothetical protein